MYVVEETDKKKMTRDEANVTFTSGNTKLLKNEFRFCYGECKKKTYNLLIADFNE